MRPRRDQRRFPLPLQNQDTKAAEHQPAMQDYRWLQDEGLHFLPQDHGQAETGQGETQAGPQEGEIRPIFD